MQKYFHCLKIERILSSSSIIFNFSVWKKIDVIDIRGKNDGWTFMYIQIDKSWRLFRDSSIQG